MAKKNKFENKLLKKFIIKNTKNKLKYMNNNFLLIKLIKYMI